MGNANVFSISLNAPQYNVISFEINRATIPHQKGIRTNVLLLYLRTEENLSH